MTKKKENLNTHIQSQNEIVLLGRTNFEEQLREIQPTIFILVSQCILYFPYYMLQSNV